MDTKIGDIYGIRQSKALFNSAKSYVQTNDMMSNVVFVLVVLIITIILFQMTAAYIFNLFSPSNNPHLIDGMVDTKDSELKIYQDPNKSGSKTILISSDQTKGLEFTWSFWVYIDDLDYRRGELKNVWVKGDNIYQDQNSTSTTYEETDVTYEELNKTINSPGVYLTPYNNKLLFVFNTFEKLFERFEIDNIPMQKWVNVIIRCENRTIDVFLNSAFTKRHVLSSLPKQNYNNVYIGKNGGFAGFVSNLWYYNRAIGTKMINDIYKGGANVNLLNDKAKNASGGSSTEGGWFDNYRINWLSFRWFSQ